MHYVLTPNSFINVEKILKIQLLDFSIKNSSSFKCTLNNPFYTARKIIYRQILHRWQQLEKNKLEPEEISLKDLPKTQT